ncbi:MAG: hypothetical protein ABS79_03825 [Planctomycetes bacterium SCN 63-9]|nr:MAG: hypothetical protein ABS79_03825 [Planctomycetes bacterium SCN 63-9]
MIPDQPLVNLAALALIGIGNLWHFIWAVNITSGLGYSEKTVDRIRLRLLAALGCTSTLLAWCAMRQPILNWPRPVLAYAAACVISALIIGPWGSLRILLRRPNVGTLRKSSNLDLREIHGADNLIGESWQGALLRIPGNESLRLRRVEWDLEFPRLPRSLHGLSVIHLTDLHFARCFRREFFEAVIDASRDWKADLVLLTGDLIDDAETLAWIEPILGRLDARLGKFAILGNHDYEHQTDAILRELRRAGFETLEGKWATIDVDGSTLAIGGTSYPWGPRLDPDDIPEADFRILMSHTPDQFPNARKWGMDFVLSGHNHGGQVRFPLVGPVFMPSRYSRRYDRGFFRSGSTVMYVSEGVAGKHPVRFGCMPEIGRFVLKSTGTAPSYHPHESAAGSLRANRV